MNLTKRVSQLGTLVGLALALLFAWSAVLAQTENATSIPEELVPLAQDLGCETNAECAEKFDANIEQGIALAQKYEIYTPEQEGLATAFKTEVLERLRTVNQDNFEEEILALANRILTEKPSLARTMGITKQTISAVETVVDTIREAGVDIRTCQKSPENLSREELIACVRASNNLSDKGELVRSYIPEKNVEVGEVQKILDLEDSLLAGEYEGLGRISVEQAGQICLKPGSGSITDCDRIAERFFGPDGVKHLQEARQETTRIKEYYAGGIERMQLVTPDGRKLIGKSAIRGACDGAFEENNLELARACGNFAVRNGLATEEEVQNGLRLLESFREKATEVSFDDCRFNPESCREFLPDEFRSQFDFQYEIFKIMSESIGFDPSRCEDTYDSDIGKRCLEGAKKALSRVEEIAKASPEARKVVDEIKSHIIEGERMTEKLGEFHQDSERGGASGPGACRSPEDCFKYCNQPTNSAECISFGAKSQIFDQSSVIQRFNVVNKGFSNPFQNQTYRPVDPGFNQYPPYQPSQPAGPSPECFAAINSGDFARAKTACSSVTENYPRPIAEPYPFPVCPAYSVPSPCPAGQVRQQASDAQGCPAYGACVALDTRPIEKVCPALATVSSCPSGQERYEVYNSKECGVYYACRTATATTTPVNNSCPEANQYRDPEKNICITQTSCSAGQYWDYVTDACATNPVVYGCGSFTTQASCQVNPGCGWANGACGGNMTTSGYCPSGQYWYTPPSGGSGYCMVSNVSSSCPAGYHIHSESGGFCMNDQENYSGTCYNSAGTATIACPQSTYIPPSSCPYGQYWNGSACVSSGSGCGSYASQASCVSASSQVCNWNTSGSNGWCQQATTATSCGNYICESGEMTSCPSDCSTYTSCPSGQYWDSPSNSCKSNTSYGSCTGTTQSSCTSTSNCYWNSSSNYCYYQSTSPSSMSCPSGQYWYTPPSGGSGYCMTSNSTTCPSGQYWNGSACVNTSTTDCTSGQYWNGSACVSSTPTTNTCSSGQWWDGTACQNITSPSGSGTACSGDQYWNGTSCVTSPTPTSYPTPEPTSYPTPSYPTPTEPTAMILCSQSGGDWTGAACNLAENISDQKAYYDYYKKISDDALLAQIIRAFTNLFK